MVGGGLASLGVPFQEEGGWDQNPDFGDDDAAWNAWYNSGGEFEGWLPNDFPYNGQVYINKASGNRRSGVGCLAVGFRDNYAEKTLPENSYRGLTIYASVWSRVSNSSTGFSLYIREIQASVGGGQFQTIATVSSRSLTYQHMVGSFFVETGGKVRLRLVSNSDQLSYFDDWEVLGGYT